MRAGPWGPSFTRNRRMWTSRVRVRTPSLYPPDGFQQELPGETLARVLLEPEQKGGLQARELQAAGRRLRRVHLSSKHCGSGHQNQNAVILLDDTSVRR